MLNYGQYYARVHIAGREYAFTKELQMNAKPDKQPGNTGIFNENYGKTVYLK
jgi:hypothetical protein